jgi:hypothetical protein
MSFSGNLGNAYATHPQASCDRFVDHQKLALALSQEQQHAANHYRA